MLAMIKQLEQLPDSVRHDEDRKRESWWAASSPPLLCRPGQAAEAAWTAVSGEKIMQLVAKMNSRKLSMCTDKKYRRPSVYCAHHHPPVESIYVGDPRLYTGDQLALDLQDCLVHTDKTRVCMTF